MRSTLALLLAGMIGLPHGSDAGAATVRIACDAGGGRYELCRDGAEAWAESSGHGVEVVPIPGSAEDQKAFLQERLSEEAAGIDVFQIDVAWTGLLLRHAVDLRSFFNAEEIDAHFSSMIENNWVNDAFLAMPWHVDTGVLFYRKDLLRKHGFPVPETWVTLTRVASAIVRAERAVGNDELVGFVFHGEAGEALTCAAIEWIASFGGGRILRSDGTVDLVNPGAVEALATATSWIGHIAPRSVLTFSREEMRAVFQAGHAVFMRDWTGAWPIVDGLGSPVAGKVGMIRLPRADGGMHIGVLGGSSLAVSKSSKNRQIAVELVRHLTSHEEQVRRAVVGAVNPTRPAAYRDVNLERARPYMVDVALVLERAVARPARIAGDKYAELSRIFRNAVHDTLSGRHDPVRNLAVAQYRLEKIMPRSQW